MKTSREVCEALGCDKGTVSRAARKLGVGKMVGTSKVFTLAEVAKLKKEIRAKPGNPSFGKAE
jgi:hypothetical protein